MRILIANANRQVVGGAETYLQALVPALEAAGHEAALLYEREAPNGAAAVDSASPRMPRWSAAGTRETDALGAVAQWRPTVAYVHGLASPTLERALLDRMPCVLFAHGYYGTCATGTKRHAWPTATPCHRRIGVACLALHYPRRCGGWSPVAAVESYRRQRERFRLLGRYRSICVASRHMREEYLRHGLPSPVVQVTPLPPTGVMRDPTLAPGAAGSGQVVYVGRVTDLKMAPNAVDAVARAARRLGRKLSLEILGEGPALPAVAARGKELGMSLAVRAWVDATTRNAVLRSSELLLVPSTWPEPWGLVGLEAACVGLPSVGYAVGGIPEWLIAGETGELAPGDPPTTEGLAQAITRALNDPPHYQRLRRGAWEQVARFTMERHLNALLPVLEDAGRTAT